jgi:ATP-dependent Lhr-like helicase
VLGRLEARGVVRKETFLPDQPGPQYVHIAVLDEVQRRQAHSRRVARPLASPIDLSASLLRRHHLHPEHRLTGPAGVLAALELLQAEDFPVRVWEQELLPGRVEDYQREWLDQLGLSGEVVFTPFERNRSGRVGVALSENLGWLRPALRAPANLDERSKAVLRHLQVRGASFARDVARATGLDPTHALAILWELFWAGLVTPDTFGAIVANAVTRSGAAPSSGQGARPAHRPRRGAPRGLTPPSRVLGRWSALAEEQPVSPDERDEARARLLLARHGVVSRELAAGDWASLRHALLRMEYGGEVARGYFVEGLSGEQYALEEALANLASTPRRAEPHVLVNVTDPANLWGRVFALTRPDGSRVTAPRVPQTWLVMRGGRPVLVADGYGRDLSILAGFDSVDLPGVVRALQSVVERPPALRPVRRLEVLTWNGRAARESEVFDALVEAGFTVDGPRLTWDGHQGPRHVR